MRIGLDPQRYYPKGLIYIVYVHVHVLHVHRSNGKSFEWVYWQIPIMASDTLTDKFTPMK